MINTRTAIALGLLLMALTWLAGPAAGQSKPPPGVSVKVLAEFPSDIPGIEKIQLQEMRLEPGAKVENDIVPDSGL